MFKLAPNRGQWATRGPEASLGHATIAGKVHVETRWKLVTASAEPDPFPRHDQEFLQLTCGWKRHLGTMTWWALATHLDSWEPSLARSSPGLFKPSHLPGTGFCLHSLRAGKLDVNQKSLDQTWPMGLLHLLRSRRPF